jgi:autotransporter-associated beta strand protein
LVLNGGTLRKVGGTSSSTNRLFTLGGSSSIESSTGNALDFTNTGSIAATGAAARTLTLAGVGTGVGSLAPNLNDATGGGGVVSLVKNGTGTWTVSGASSNFSGGTTVTAGLLTMGSASALGSTSGQLTVNGGTLNMASFNLTVGNLTGSGGTISGTAGGTRTLTIGQGNGTGGNFQGSIANGSGGTTALTKIGTGTITLAGTSTYTGNTTISAGTLLLDGTHTGGGLYSLSSNATLGGSGSTASTLNVSGIIAPGNSIDTLDTGTVTWNGAASAGSATHWVFELGASDTADLLNITGDFNGNTGVGSVFRFDFAGSTHQGTFDLVTWSGNTTFVSPNSEFTYTNLGGGNTGTFQFGGVGNKTLQFVAVPEPAAMAILGAAFALSGIQFARRRKV